MDASGPIFVVLAVACLFYLVPRQLSWRIPTQQQVDQQAPLHLSMKTVHAGKPVEQTGESEQPSVSTLLMRRAGRRTALRLARRAEKRRQTVFIVLSLITVGTVPFAVIGLQMRWWVPLVGVGTVVVWAFFSQIEARRVQKQLDAIVADVELGDDEKTVAIALQQAVEPVQVPDIVGPNGDVQSSLWDPITVVPATYISAPTSRRTIRTIDLNPKIPKLPVTDNWRNDDGRIAI